MNFQELREKHKQFIYEGFEIVSDNGQLKAYFNFTITPSIKFRPEVILPNVSEKRLKEIGQNVLNNLIFNLGLIEMISYWKATCSPEIIIKAGYLNEEQIKWWKDLLIKGLGQFFYENKIDFTSPNLVKFTITSSDHPKGGQLTDAKFIDRDLILVGGGKDSAVTLETFKGNSKEFGCLMLNPTHAAEDIAGVGGCKNPIIIKRTIDPKLLELNKKGYLNGHTPFSAYLAFLSILCQVIYNYKNGVVSDETSSSEGNVLYHGQIINHQYSKSLEFEEKFKSYSKKYLTSEANYYSYLRSFNDIQIARQFSRLEKYHQVFRSCNVGSKMGGIWCGHCSKCLFTYLILYPFLGEKLKNIFGKDLLNDESLSPVMEELLQLPGKFKPFECVGNKEEIEYAMLLSILKLRGQQLPKLLEKYKDQVSILILGVGREGGSTLGLLKKYFTGKQIGTADKKDGDNYLDKLSDFDIIFKSPGIPYHPEIIKAKEDGKIITSVTQIFFDLFEGKIIGVTGTKGKSTTASLIYEVLKAGLASQGQAWERVELVGNIGKPALDLLEVVNEKSIVVYELSSFQLADLQKSPQVAVITNIYPEHLDWHGTFENYKKAKENIKKYQEADDVLITDQYGAEAAKTVGRLFKIPEDKINQAIIDFKPLPHRLEFVGEVKGIKFYNDSLSTIPQATIFALNKLGDGVQTLIAGGFDRGVDYSVLGPAIAKSKIKNLILFPDTGEKIWKALNVIPGTNEVRIPESKKDSGQARMTIRKFDVSSMEEAVQKAFKVTSPGKICLLSPASSSFNMFKDYEDRGNQFKKLVLDH